jgi:hypothetical protein
MLRKICTKFKRKEKFKEKLLTGSSVLQIIVCRRVRNYHSDKEVKNKKQKDCFFVLH